MRWLPIWTVALAALLLTTWPAAAQQMTREDIELRNQIYALQQQVQALQQQVSQQQQRGGGSNLGQPGGYPPPQSGGNGGNDLVAQLLTQVQSLEGEVRDLRGRVDETQNQLQQQAADLGKRIDDLAFRMQNPQGAPGTPGEEAPPAGPTPEGAAGVAPGAPQQQPRALSPPPAPLGATRAAPHAAAPEPPPAPVHLTPEQAVARGSTALARHDYPAAEAAAREVLNNYRTSPRAYEAQYILAQALAGQRRYAQAAIAYDDTYNRNRKGTRAPEALVGLANSLTAINEKRAACDTLSKLHAEFPQEHPDIRDAAASVRQRAGCH